MKNILAYALTGALAVSAVSCTTTYDAYGNPRNSVDPGTAVAGAAAAGILGYAIANKRSSNNRHYDHHNSHRRGYYDRRGHYHRY
ncbi:MAG: hypothetical protein ABJQ29_02725 [Luteolibacter sp.]